MSKHHTRVHQAFLDLKKPYDPVDIYETMCKLVKVPDDACERGIGKLYREGKLKLSLPKRKKKSGGGRRGDPLDNL